MKHFKKAACTAAAVMALLTFGSPAARPAERLEYQPAAVRTNAKQTGYYAYIPDHSIYFVDTGAELAWAYRAVDYLAGGGVVSGVGEHLFAPSKPITRADFMVMLYRAYNMGRYSGQTSFSDVPPEAYYAEAVSAAETLGIAAGSSGRFYPEEKMTREDAMVFLKRTLDLTGLRFEAGSLAEFADAKEISSYAVEAVGALAKAGVIAGGSDGLLRPAGEITRAEMAAMLYRALHLSDEGVYTAEPERVNLCIGDTIYTDVRIEGYEPGRVYEGLMRCLTFYQTADGYFVQLGEPEAIDQQIEYEDGRLTVDGEVMALAEDVVCVNVSPYSTLERPVSTGGDYSTARVAVLEERVTEIYYCVSPKI